MMSGIRHLCNNSVREIRDDCLTTRPISSFKSRMFRGLFTYTNDLRVHKGKNIKRVKSHDFWWPLMITITRDEAIHSDKKCSQLAHVAQY